MTDEFSPVVDQEEISYSTEYEISGDTLIKKTTPDQVLPTTESYNIPEIQIKKEKAQSALAKWQSIINECDAILTEYNKLND